MHKLIDILLFSVFFFYAASAEEYVPNIRAVSVEEASPDTLTSMKYPSLMHYLPQMERRAANKIYYPQWDETRYFNRDSLFIRYATLGYEAVKDELRYYYDDILDPIPDREGRMKEQNAVRRAIRQIASHSLNRELEYAEALASPETTPEELEQKLQRFRKLIDKYTAKGDPEIELRALSYLVTKCLGRQLYHEGFLNAERLARRLDAVSEKDYSGYYLAWADLGHAYYEFRDYKRAVLYLKKALRETPATSFHDRSNLRSRSTLGIYYQSTAALDTSDYYFHSMLESGDQVKLRPMFDCIALSNLGTNLRARKRFREAIAYHRAALPGSIAEQDWSFTSSIYVGLAECYLETGDPPRCRLMLDSVRHYISLAPWVMSYRSCDLYPMEARYYGAIGNNRLALAYMDSTTLANREQEKAYNSMVILRAEQELFRSEQERKDLQIVTFRRTAIICAIAAGIILVVLLIIAALYRKKRRDYRMLAARSREWAQRMSPTTSPVATTEEVIEPDATDLALMETIGQLIEQEHIHLNSELDLDQLANRLGVHRNMISKAVNTVHRKTFSAFINDCRVREAILLLSDPEQDHLSFENIAYDTGFGSRQTFYRVFKAHTGLTPPLFRKNREAIAD